ncbi:MAG: hypothetical protein AB1445_08100 [Bacillota bacterium]
MARQINERGKRIRQVTAAHSPHKFAWYEGDPGQYAGLLAGKTMGPAASYEGLVEIKADDTVIVLGDGVNLRLHGDLERRPPKHQLLMEFQDGWATSASV